MSQRARSLRPVAGGARIFQRIFTRLGCSGRPPHFVVEYYPYADLTLTIRLREESANIRLSDLLRGAPLPLLEAAAAILLARIYRRRVPRKLVEIYRRFSYARTTRRRLLAARKQRARRVKEAPRGSCHDLGPLYDELNRRFFRGKLRRPRLDGLRQPRVLPHRRHPWPISELAQQSRGEIGTPRPRTEAG